MTLPGDMTIQIHVGNDSEPNALATLGGNIVINRVVSHAE
jgi:predicted Zn-dependent protease